MEMKVCFENAINLLNLNLLKGIRRQTKSTFPFSPKIVQTKIITEADC